MTMMATKRQITVYRSSRPSSQGSQKWGLRTTSTFQAICQASCSIPSQSSPGHSSKASLHVCGSRSVHSRLSCKIQTTCQCSSIAPPLALVASSATSTRMCSTIAYCRQIITSHPTKSQMECTYLSFSLTSGTSWALSTRSPTCPRPVSTPLSMTSR